MPLFSIITVVLNDVDGLRRTAESIAQQTARDFEWKIIDGVSRDGTRELAFELAQQDDRFVAVSQRDTGLYDAMNNGLALASGTYVIFMNAGDAFANNEVIADLSRELGDSPIDILYCGAIMRFGKMDVRRPAKPSSYIWHGQPALHQATVVRRSLHANHRFRTDMRICADYECLCRMVGTKPSQRSSDIVVSINEMSRGSVSNKSKMTLLRESYRVQRDILRISLVSRIASLTRRGINSIAAKSFVFFARAK